MNQQLKRNAWRAALVMAAAFCSGIGGVSAAVPVPTGMPKAEQLPIVEVRRQVCTRYYLRSGALRTVWCRAGTRCIRGGGCPNPQAGYCCAPR